MQLTVNTTATFATSSQVPIVHKMPISIKMFGTLASVAALMVEDTTTVEGHAFQMKPVSRQYSRTMEFNDG